MLHILFLRYPEKPSSTHSTKTVIVRAISPLVELGVSIGRSSQEAGNDEEASSIHLEVGFPLVPSFLRANLSRGIASGRVCRPNEEFKGEENTKNLQKGGHGSRRRYPIIYA